MKRLSGFLKGLATIGQAFGTTSSDFLGRVDNLNEDQATVLKEMAELRLNTIAEGKQSEEPKK